MPTGYLNWFVENIDDALKLLYKPKVELLICGDIYTGYIIESNQKNNQLRY